MTLERRLRRADHRKQRHDILALEHGGGRGNIDSGNQPKLAIKCAVQVSDFCERSRLGCEKGISRAEISGFREAAEVTLHVDEIHRPFAADFVGAQVFVSQLANATGVHRNEFPEERSRDPFDT